VRDYAFCLSSFVPISGARISAGVAVLGQTLPKLRCLKFRQVVENRAVCDPLPWERVAQTYERSELVEAG
jgi:hypothetical protein